MGARRRATHLSDQPTDEELLSTSSRDLETLFRSSPPGDLPSGEFRGTVCVLPGTRLAPYLARAARLLLWQGKVVDRERGDLKNRVSPFRLEAVRAKVFPGDSWVDHHPCVVIDYSTTSWVARPVRDEVRVVAPGVYLGVVWLWRRRVARFLLRSTG